METEKQIATCSGCGNDYEPRPPLSILGHVVKLDTGRCPSCQDAWTEGLRQQEEAARQAAWSSVRREARMTCGIPVRYQQRDLSTFDRARQPKIWQLCWDCAEGYKLGRYQSLLLSGAAGLGKSHLSYGIAHRVLDRWTAPAHWRTTSYHPTSPVRCVVETDLYRSIRATYSLPFDQRSSANSEQGILNRLIGAPLLVLDDLGRERPSGKQDGAESATQFVQRILFTIVNTRYDAELPMVINTMLTADQLRRYLRDDQGNEPIWDRLVEMTGGRFVRLTGESYRGKKPGR